ncbi:3-hydroxyacyl-ACP dehydratase FabZ [Heliobacterium gestii]|uniref:3-hydroxyacyl-[acyl-carrier-protein] dehydratase FabZ n=1 Tax=Heliomicrobium gestii TaxID=2699 RepID=A0A845LA27_HELGE|nr:3-hydroxyacyl-ACP dehydratase FabZ [Heliomicrobium gestii]MBM7866652.1 3-hydroxyacyl-[acyl-carrier-protein] dehydratase [Heliomicrobium gestii]MZP43068.1 3-hydroxyacyl-ACP dehydratase FabZ [Heliomicrobium gestii]
MREKVNLSVQDIQGILPHRPPFLLVDRIIELEVGKWAVGLKNVTMNEPFFQGHFPGHPVMPGVLIVEALAQTGAVALLKMPEYAGKIALFAKIDGVRFRRPVVPGDTLRLEAEMTALRKTIGKAMGRAYVEDQLVCEAEMTFAIEQ